MINKQDLKDLKKRYERLEEMRRELQKLSGDAQRLAKQAIFSVQRGEMETGAKLIDQAEGLLKQGKKLAEKESRLTSEGMWRASLEEFAEAVFFLRLVTEDEIRLEISLIDDPNLTLGALSDAVGELVRVAVRAATEHEPGRVEMAYAKAEQVVEFLTSIDLTGGLRSKGDQARSHLRRLEDIRYDLALRHGAEDEA